MNQLRIMKISVYTGIGAVVVGLLAFSENWNVWGGGMPGYEILLFPGNLTLVYVWHPVFTEEIDFWPKLALHLLGQFIPYTTLDFNREGLMNNQRRALFLSHGGGPLPLLGDGAHAEMVSCLKKIAGTISRPSSIIVVSAHWEAETPTVTSGENPALIYDYNGFPPESYEIKYPCPGNPSLARSLMKQFEKAGINASSDNARGFDHGLFVPLKIMYPEADIPCVQLSLVRSLDPLVHIKLGRALQDLADPSMLLVGSGFSFHNMKAFYAPETADSGNANESFERWLGDTISNPDISEEERTKRLVDWEGAPFARYCHPREEHLLPLHVCYGFAESTCTELFQLKILRKDSSMYLWGH